MISWQYRPFNIENKNIYKHENCTCEITNKMRPSFGIMKEVPISFHSGEMSAKPTVIETPDYFNWKEYEGEDWTIPAKTQDFPKWCGSCWAFAALGIIESAINIREGIADLDPHLSVQYVLSCLYGGDCDGGQMHTALKAIMDNRSKGNNCNGIIPEACFP